MDSGVGFQILSLTECLSAPLDITAKGLGAAVSVHMGFHSNFSGVAFLTARVWAGKGLLLLVCSQLRIYFSLRLESFVLRVFVANDHSNLIGLFKGQVFTIWLNGALKARQSLLRLTDCHCRCALSEDSVRNLLRLSHTRRLLEG